MGYFQAIIYEKREGIAYATLNRPEKLNTYNLQMRDELFQVLEAIRDDDEVKVAIFSGAGDKAFCAGADLSEFLTAPSPAVAREVRFKRDVWGLFLSLSTPLIAALHGYVLGSGLEIALCSDVRIASEDTQFGFPEAGLGIIPAAGGTQTLPRVIGRARALEMLLSGRKLSAAEAYDIGLVNQVVPPLELISTAEALARKIITNSPVAIKNIKQAVNQGLNLSLEEGLKLEQRLFALTLATLPERF